MTDVFISYASEDIERARKLARALEAGGRSVWWDRKIIAGQSFDQVIEHELETAKCVVVLWSKDSIFSDWVKSEAAAAAERGVLVPALIDNVKLPLEFRRKQTANLVGWDGNPSHEGFQALCDAVATKATNRNAAQRQSTTVPPRGFWQRRWLLGASVGIAVGIITALIQSGIFDGTAKPPVLADKRADSPAQAQEPSTKIAGTWQAGESAGLQSYTFHSNGTYTYAGTLATRGPGGGEIHATKDEDGVYQISGDKLVIARQRGSFSTPSTNRALEPETRVYRWSVGNTQVRPALQLIWPSGEAEIFYKR